MRCMIFAAVLLVLAVVTPVFAEVPPQYLFQWGIEGTGEGQFTLPYSVAVDDSGFVYVTDCYNNRIQKFTWNGQFVLSWGTEGGDDGQLRHPTGIRIGWDGYVYVCDLNNMRIQKFTRWGGYTSQFGNAPGDPILLEAPYDIAFGPDSLVYVSDCSSNHQVVKYTRDDHFVERWPTPYNNNHGIDIDPNGYVYVADGNRDSVYVFDGHGIPQNTWYALDGVTGLDMDDSERIYVTGYLSNTCAMFTTTGELLCEWLGGDGGLLNSTGIVVSNSGLIYVADRGNHRIQVFGDPTSDVTTNEHPTRSLAIRSFPNPFGATGSVAFTLPLGGATSLDLFDVRGRLIERLVDRRSCSSGWNIVPISPSRSVPAGAYFLRLSAGNKTASQKIIIVR